MRWGVRGGTKDTEDVWTRLGEEGSHQLIERKKVGVLTNKKKLTKTHITKSVRRTHTEKKLGEERRENQDLSERAQG